MYGSSSMKETTITAFLLMFALALHAGFALSTTVPDETPSSPADVCPALIGSAVPDITVSAPDGVEIELRSVLAESPTVLVYYRGGW